MQTKMEKIVSLCKRRGFINPGSELYGGLSGTWDFGPLGVLFKMNIKSVWWKNMVQQREDVIGLETPIIMNSKVWEASGHTKFMTDMLVECKKCHLRFRADQLEGNRCSECWGELLAPRPFNLMFKTFVGSVEDEAAKTYLRPETAQGMFIDFNYVREVARQKLPFGIAQIGKTFRNEITPGNFVFRAREFEQMEMEFFCKSNEADRWYKYWRDERMRWWTNLGIKKQNLRFREYSKEELAHYSLATVDIEYAFPFGKDGWDELEGIANRGDYDLKVQAKESGQDLTYFDEETKSKILPYVIEPSAGVERAALAFLLDAYEEIEGGRTTTTKATKETEIVLRLHKSLAPIKVAVLPLSKKKELTLPALQIANQLRLKWSVDYDEVASIGRRYRRQDEIGTPFCVTYDFDSPHDKKVTVRDRDTMQQVRIAIGELEEYLQEKLD